jgi:hypothetical protein
MTTQLTLLPTTPAPWQLDDTTRAIGREGLAQARRALAQATLRVGEQSATTDPFSRAA